MLSDIGRVRVRFLQKLQVSEEYHPWITIHLREQQEKAFGLLFEAIAGLSCECGGQGECFVCRVNDWNGRTV